MGTAEGQRSGDRRGPPGESAGSAGRTANTAGSGIDILRFDQSAKAPTTQQIDTSWLAKAHVVDSWSSIMRLVCRQNGKATPAQLAKLGVAGHHA